MFLVDPDPQFAFFIQFQSLYLAEVAYIHSYRFYSSLTSTPKIIDQILKQGVLALCQCKEKEVRPQDESVKGTGMAYEMGMGDGENILTSPHYIIP